MKNTNETTRNKYNSYNLNIYSSSSTLSSIRRRSIIPTQTLFSTKNNDDENNNNNNNNINTSPTTNFILPIFPLRKAVKLPTTSLQLNLFEKRYLALSKYVIYPTVASQQLRQLEQNQLLSPSSSSSSSLSSSSPSSSSPSDSYTSKIPRHMLNMFGAVYCSHKAQMVKGGNEPITPILQPMDIGVICQVQQSTVEFESSSSPTKTYNNTYNNTNDGEDDDDSVVANNEEKAKDNLEDINKIRLGALVVGRLQIERIITNGFQGDTPYILAEVSLLQDENIYQNDDDDDAVVIAEDQDDDDDDSRIELQDSEELVSIARKVIEASGRSEFYDLISGDIDPWQYSLGTNVYYDCWYQMYYPRINNIKWTNDKDIDEINPPIASTNHETSTSGSLDTTPCTSRLLEIWSFVVISNALEQSSSFCSSKDVLEILACTSSKERLEKALRVVSFLSSN